jgi:MoaA/NifB/PqqE/SkfB family radical SAM enzyme
LYIDPTYRCNLNCITCKSPQVAVRFKGEPVMTGADHRRVIEEFAALGGRRVSVYGGEPLLMNETFEIVDEARRLGLKAEVCTNGLLLDAERSARLIKSGLGHLTVSIDGVGDVYESIRGKGSFARLERGIRAFQEVNHSEGRNQVPVSFTVTVSRNNVEHLAPVLDFASSVKVDKVGYGAATQVRPETAAATAVELDAPVRTEWNHWDLPSEILIAGSQLGALRDQIPLLEKKASELKIELAIDPALATPQPTLPEASFRLTKKCQVAEEDVYVNPNGGLTMCPMLQHHQVANIRDTPMHDYWEGNPHLLKLRKTLKTG